MTVRGTLFMRIPATDADINRGGIYSIQSHRHESINEKLKSSTINPVLYKAPIGQVHTSSGRRWFGGGGRGLWTLPVKTGKVGIMNQAKMKKKNSLR